MSFKGETALFFVRGTYVALAALAAALLVLSGAFFSSARAQNTVSGDGNNVNDQENTCNNVVRIIVEEVQNPNTDNTISSDVNATNSQSVQGSTTGDVSNEQAVEVSNEQVVDIAQELNISPTIVQNCIQQNAGDDAIIVDDDDDDDGNNNGKTNKDGTDPDDDAPVGKKAGIVDDVSTEALPVTGGPDLVASGIALSIVVSGVALSGLLLVKSRRQRT